MICDDDDLFHLSVKHALKSKFNFHSAKNGDEAIVLLKKTPIDVMILDVQMRTNEEGLDFIPRFLEHDSDLAIIMASGLTEFSVVKRAMQLGAFDYVPKDFDINDLEHTLELAIKKRALTQKLEEKTFELNHEQKKHLLIGESKAMIDLRRTIEKARKSPAHVLITGETGTGKEVVARLLRNAHPDGDAQPFISIDSSTIQNTMAESILFGHEKGAFTGADKTTKGCFEEANGGIIYFDELSNMPLEIQSKLLRAIQEKEIKRVGSNKIIPLDFRVVAATNQNLLEKAKEGRFKEDLYQRLNVIPISIPPLRERTEDIPLLLQHFAQTHSFDSKKICFTDEAITILKQYNWPGNVRELSNLVSYLTAMSDQTEIDVTDLPPTIRDYTTTSSTFISSSKLDGGEKKFYAKIAAYEEELLRREYQNFSANISQMALGLGMDRSHLYAKLKQYKIHESKERHKN